MTFKHATTPMPRRPRLQPLSGLPVKNRRDILYKNVKGIVLGGLLLHKQNVNKLRSAVNKRIVISVLVDPRRRNRLDPVASDPGLYDDNYEVYTTYYTHVSKEH